MGLIPGLGSFPGELNGNPFHILSWEVHGQRRLVGYCPWGCKKLDMTEHTCMHAPGIKDKLVTKAGKNCCSGGADRKQHIKWEDEEEFNEGTNYNSVGQEVEHSC